MTARMAVIAAIHDDPDWQAARDVYVSDHPGDGTAASDFIERASAIHRMYEIELRHEQAAAPTTAAA